MTRWVVTVSSMKLPKLITALALSAIVVAGCAPSPNEPEASAPESNTAATPSQAETSEPEETSSSQPEATSSSDDTSSATSDQEDYNKYDGILTNEFLGALDNVGDLRQESIESDPQKYRVEARHFNADKTVRTDTFIYIPKVDGETQPVTSLSDPGMEQAYNSGVDVFKQDGHDVTEREVQTTSQQWRCMEATQTQGGDIDHALCITPFAGRVVEVQRLILHKDNTDSEKMLDELLQNYDDALATLS